MVRICRSSARCCVIALFSVQVLAAHAQVTNRGFETGDLSGWSSFGDNQVQTTTFGTVPSEGVYQSLSATATDALPPLIGGVGASPSSAEASLALTPGSLSSVNGTAYVASAIGQTVHLVAGQVLTFDWDFLTNQTYNDGTSDSIPPSRGNNDFGFFTFSPSGGSSGIVKLADTFYGFGVNANAPGGFVTGLKITNPANPFISETGYLETTWTVPASGDYTLGFGVVAAGSNNGVNSGLLVDNVRASAVPEPSSFVVLGVFGLGVLGRRRNR